MPALAAVLAGLLACPALSLAGDASLAGLGGRVLSDYAAPAAARFGVAAEAMPGLIRAACATLPARAEEGSRAQGQAGPHATLPPGPAAAALEQGFTRLVERWAPLELLRFGPLVQGNRFERIFFWPDPRGVVARQVQSAIGARDVSLLAPGALAAGSVALQGVPALEFALYGGQGALLPAAGMVQAVGNGAAAAQAAVSAPPPVLTPLPTSAALPSPATVGPDAPSYRCQLAQAIAAQLAATAASVARDWQPGSAFARTFVQPGADNPLYRSSAEVAAEWVKALSGGLQFQRDAKLVPALGTSPASARAQRAPLARSGRTLVALASATEAAGRLFAAAQIASALPPAQQGLADGVPRQADALATQLRSIDLPWDAAVTDPQARAQLRQIDDGLRTLKSLIDEPVAGALGVQLGFNALDGD